MPSAVTTTPRSPRRWCRTRPWCGCGCRPTATSTSPSRTRCMAEDIAWGTLRRPVCAYVYDTAALRARTAEVRACLPPSAILLYAVKANGNPAVVAALAEVCDGLEIASGGELALAVAAGAERIVFGGPGKTDAELGAAVAAGALINVESVHELRRLASIAPAPPQVCLRVNRPGGGLRGSHTMTGT